MMSLWDALRMNMMISYQELVRTFLKHTNHSIIDVINMTGYENASHCYKVFKEKYNMSIKEYRDLNS